MRIIAGQLGGRLFQAPRGHRTHPMSDKMRGALFAILGDDITRATVLDAFAGSGALSFEALSRGANQVVAIERDRSAQIAIRDNCQQLAITTQLQLISARAEAWLKTSETHFDIVLLDPPYDDIQPVLLQRLVERLRPDGILLLSYPGKITPPGFKHCELITSKQYGDGSLHKYVTGPKLALRGNVAPM